MTAIESRGHGKGDRASDPDSSPSMGLQQRHGSFCRLPVLLLAVATTAPGGRRGVRHKLFMRISLSRAQVAGPGLHKLRYEQTRGVAQEHLEVLLSLRAILHAHS